MELIIFLIVLAISITLHEFTHALSSYMLGDDTAYLKGRLTINPLAHVDWFTTVLMPVLLYLSGFPPIGAAKPVPFNPYRVRWGDIGAAIVSVSGPVTNLLLALVSAIPLRLGIGLPSLAITFFEIMVILNLAFFVFNMIPWPPLDGSRLLYALAPEPLRRFMKTVEGYGLFGLIIFLLVVLPVVSPIIVRAIQGLTVLFVGQDILI